MELSGYLAIIRRWALILVASAVLAGGVAYFVARSVPPTYASEASILVGPSNTDQNTLGASESLVQTYAFLVTTSPVLQQVIDQAELSVPVGVLRANVIATANSVQRILDIEVRAAEPETAATIANGLATELQRRASEGPIVRPEGAVTIVQPAEPDPIPVEPQVSLLVVLAAVAGLIAASALVLGIDYFNNSVRSREDLSSLAQAPFLGSVPFFRRFRADAAGPLVVEARPNSRAALAYRLMGTRITAGDPSSDVKTLVVLGAEGREGSGEVAANLAAVMTRTGRRVRLVDANDDEREITRLFEIETNYGLGELIRGGDELLERMRHRRPPGMDVIPHIPGSDPRILEQGRARLVLHRLLADADLLILNTAALHRSASALTWCRLADAAVLVTRRDKTKRENVTFTVEGLKLLGTPILGTVLHGGQRRGSSAELPEADADPRRRRATRQLDDLDRERAAGLETAEAAPVSRPRASE